MPSRKTTTIVTLLSIVALAAVGTRWLGSAPTEGHPEAALSVTGLHLGESARWPHWWGCFPHGRSYEGSNGIIHWDSDVAFVSDPYHVKIKDSRFVFVGGHTLQLDGKTILPTDSDRRAFTQAQVHQAVLLIQARVPGRLAEDQGKQDQYGMTTFTYLFPHGKLEILSHDYSPQFWLTEDGIADD